MLLYVPVCPSVDVLFIEVDLILQAFNYGSTAANLISTAPGLTLSSQAIKCVFLCTSVNVCVCEALQIFAFCSIPSHHALPCPHLVFVCVWIGSDSCLTPLHRQTPLSYLPVVLRTTSTALFSGGREVMCSPVFSMHFIQMW